MCFVKLASIDCFLSVIAAELQKREFLDYEQQLSVHVNNTITLDFFYKELRIFSRTRVS